VLEDSPVDEGVEIRSGELIHTLQRSGREKKGAAYSQWFLRAHLRSRRRNEVGDAWKVNTPELMGRGQLMREHSQAARYGVLIPVIENTGVRMLPLHGITHRRDHGGLEHLGESESER
jgi:hypothetical protein